MKKIVLCFTYVCIHS